MSALLIALLLSQAADVPLKDEGGKEITLILSEKELVQLATNIKVCEVGLKTCKEEIAAAPTTPHWVWFTLAIATGLAAGLSAGYAIGVVTTPKGP